MRLKWMFCTLAAICLTVTAAGAAGFHKSREYTDGLFSDVSADDWFRGSVAAAYEYGLMDGVSGTSFSPGGNITVAEAVTVAVRIHSATRHVEPKLPEVGDDTWYAPYVAYAEDAGIIEKGAYTDEALAGAATRVMTADMVARAVTEDVLTKINDICLIPDLPRGDPYHDGIKKLYDAGILCGNDCYGSFAPYTVITRAETAAVIERVIKDWKRKEKTWQLPKTLTLAQATEVTAFLYAPTESDLVTVMSVGDHPVSLTEYGYAYKVVKGYMFPSDPAFSAQLEALLKHDAAYEAMIMERGVTVTSEAFQKEVVQRYGYACRTMGDVWNGVTPYFAACAFVMALFAETLTHDADAVDAVAEGLNVRYADDFDRLIKDVVKG